MNHITSIMIQNQVQGDVEERKRSPIIGVDELRLNSSRNYSSFYCGQTARGNCPIFTESSSALKKESIAHFSLFLANCSGVGQIFEGQKIG
jgi:hypothetical protein